MEKNKLGFETTLKEIRTMVKGSKVTEKQNKTGSSFFEGSKRFCKIVQTGKELIYLELNVHLPKDLEKIQGMSTYSKVEASKKHLGTLVHIYRTNEDSKIKSILQAAWKAFRSEVTVEEKAAGKDDDKNSPKADNKPAGENVNKTSKPGAKNKKAGTDKDKAEKGQNGVITRTMNEEDINRLKQMEAQGKIKPTPAAVEDAEAPKEKIGAAEAMELMDKAFEQLEEKEQQELVALNK